MIAENTVNQIDALDLLRALPEASVDCVLTDPPYGTTACAWDTPIDLVAWWAAVRRVVKPRAAIVMTASQPFTSALVMSNVGMFRYSWVWDKVLPVGHLNAEIMPLRRHEDVLVFSDGAATYSPQLTPRPTVRSNLGTGRQFRADGTHTYGAYHKNDDRELAVFYPASILQISNANHTDREHPTQKPVALFEYLIRTYTRPGDLVVDPFCGSGTTGVAARQLDRRFIMGDTSEEYVAIARRRVTEPFTPQLFPEADAVDDAPRQVEMFAESHGD